MQRLSALFKTAALNHSATTPTLGKLRPCCHFGSGAWLCLWRLVRVKCLPAQLPCLVNGRQRALGADEKRPLHMGHERGPY